MNVVFLTGRLTKDPEIRYTQNQKPVASFALAVERDYKNADGEKPADFINCVAWTHTASFMEKYITKGMKIAVKGSVQTRRWQDRDGNNRYSIEVVCETVEILSGSRHGQRANGEYEPRQRSERPARRQDDDEPGSGYDVYSPPGLEDMGDGGLPY